MRMNPPLLFVYFGALIYMNDVFTRMGYTQSEVDELGPNRYARIVPIPHSGDVAELKAKAGHGCQVVFMRRGIETEEYIQSILPSVDFYFDVRCGEPTKYQKMVGYVLEHSQNPIIRFSSFGLKYSDVVDADWTIDCRSLPNPYWVEELREKNGLDEEVVEWLEGHKEVREYIQKKIERIDEKLKQWVADGKKYIHIAVGCTGGQHRSVYLATALAKHYASSWQVMVTHREKWRFMPQ